MFGLVFMNFMKLERLHGENKKFYSKNSIAIKLRYFHCISHCLFHGAKLMPQYYSEFMLDVRLKIGKGLLAILVAELR